MLLVKISKILGKTIDFFMNAVLESIKMEEHLNLFCLFLFSLYIFTLYIFILVDFVTAASIEHTEGRKMKEFLLLMQLCPRG